MWESAHEEPLTVHLFTTSRNILLEYIPFCTSTHYVLFQVISHLCGENSEGPPGASAPQGHQPGQRAKGETEVETNVGNNSLKMAIFIAGLKYL